ncbi:hypothetical protein C2G38_2119918, partial [Gigaspora rosea]
MYIFFLFFFPPLQADNPFSLFIFDSQFFFLYLFSYFLFCDSTCLMVLRRRKSTVEFSRSCVHADSQFFSYFFSFQP